MGCFVTNDCCFSRFFRVFGRFFYFLTDFDVIEWEKRSEWLLGVGVGVAIYNEKASSLKITFLASFEVILGHCRSFQVILAFKTPRKRFVACGSRKKRVLRVCWSLFTRCLRYLRYKTAK